MTKFEEQFHHIASEIQGAQEGKMFGALCIKAPNGKSGVMFWKDDMIFKLEGKELDEALALKGAKMFEPMDGRPMNGWAHIPNVHAAKWKKYAEKAMDFVKKIEAPPKEKKKKK